jgi:hypothetical protein
MEPTSMTQSNRTVLSPMYDRAIKFAVVEQLVLGVLAALLLDGGATARTMVWFIAAFWLVFAMIAVRRPFRPTTADLAIVKWGSLVCLLALAHR